MLGARLAVLSDACELQARRRLLLILQLSYLVAGNTKTFTSHAVVSDSHSHNKTVRELVYSLGCWRWIAKSQMQR